MEDQPLKNTFFHFRFKFLAITSIAFLLYIILSSPSEFDQFTSTLQFKLMGPYFILAGFFFLVFKRFPIKCPNCYKLVSTKKDWECNSCHKLQGKDRYLIDKCVHCRQMQASSVCEHCKKEFRL